MRVLWQYGGAYSTLTPSAMCLGAVVPPQSDRYRLLRERAFEYTFLLNEVGALNAA